MKGLRMRGFTLVELVLVISILSIVALGAVPAIQSTGEAQSVGAAKKLVADLAYARRLAQSRSAVYGITFDAVAETYTVHLYDSDTGISTPIADPLSRAPMIVDYSTLPGLKGTNIVTPNFTGGSTVRFMPQGTPIDATGTALANPGSVVLSRGGAARTVLVQPNTGEVSYQ